MGNKLSQEAKKTGKFNAPAQGLTETPAFLVKISALKELWLQDNDIGGLPEEAPWGALEVLYLTNNARITALPECAGTWRALQEVNLSGTGVTALPDAAEHWTDLRQIYLNGLPLESLPGGVAAWTELRVFHAADGGGTLAHLPPGVTAWRKAAQIRLDASGLVALPEGVGAAWASCEKLFLNHNRLAALPLDMSGMVALEKLYANGNAPLATLPASLASLPRLLEVYAMDCGLTELPSALADCPRLRILRVDRNPQLTALPEGLGGATLELLGCSGCALTHLPDSLSSARALKFLHASDNAIESLSPGLADLRELRVVELDRAGACVERDAELIERLRTRLVKGWKFDVEDSSEEGDGAPPASARAATCVAGSHTAAEQEDGPASGLPTDDQGDAVAASEREAARNERAEDAAPQPSPPAENT